MPLKIRCFFGVSAKPYLPDLARLRIEVYKDYPYLYDGDLAYEENYLSTFMDNEESILVIAFHESSVVGVSSGIPLIAEPPEIQAPWIQQGKAIEKFFYLSESVLKTQYRGQGLGIQFFQEREQWAINQGYEVATFCGVVRPMNHPLCPPYYVPLDNFWIKRGYQKMEGYQCKMSWKEVGSSEETTKSMQFWFKNLQVT